MHELGVTQNLLNLALRHAQQANAVRIKELNLVIGELSSILDDSVQFYWDMVAEGTIAQGSTLNFKRIPARLHCDACGSDFGMNRQDFACPTCASPQIRIADGDQFFLESIDVDLEPSPE
jgi:hydrogenase nickel incorporation protein HypA/HybF